jgi:thiamine-phosphate pyrophosphorylase
MKYPADAQLYGILDLGYVDAGSATEVADGMLDGGVQILQLRAKGRTAGEILSVAQGLAVICRKFGVPLILNDHPELVGEAGADGVHVGQDDVSVAEARSLAGEGAIVGLSTHSLAQAEASVVLRPDYIGFGPLFATPTKPDYAAIGTGDVREVHRRVSLPVFCIGGIKRENLKAVIEAGAQRVVIVSGILTAPDIAAYVRECLTFLNSPPPP